MKPRLTLMLIAAILVGACSDQRSPEVHLTRLEQTLFSTPPEALQATLIEHREDYATALLNIAPADPTAMAMMRDFVADTTMRHIYHIVDSLYHDLGWLERELRAPLYRAAKAIPGLHYDHFYTLITGDFQDYQVRVFCDHRDLAISLDHYAVGQMGNIVPAYIERLCQPQYMVADCMSAIAQSRIAMPTSNTPTLLDYTIAEGKRLYFVKQTMPDIDDTILFRYTDAQLQWVQRNLAQVWGHLIQSQLLYSHDRNAFHNLIDEAPKTNAFGDGSAPRTPAYIGYQIVSRYMRKSDITMQALFEQTDSQQILTASGWRP